MGAMAFQSISLLIVYFTVYSDADQIKHQSPASLTGEFPAQMASNSENVSIWWRHHDCIVAISRHLSLAERRWIIFYLVLQ